MALMKAWKNRSTCYTFTITDSAGDVIQPQAGDILRVRIHRAGQSPVLIVLSSENTSNGSSLSFGVSSVLTLVAADLDIPAGTYSMSLDYYDLSETEWKGVDEHVFFVEELSI